MSDRPRTQFEQVMDVIHRMRDQIDRIEAKLDNVRVNLESDWDLLGDEPVDQSDYDGPPPSSSSSTEGDGWVVGLPEHQTEKLTRYEVRGLDGVKYTVDEVKAIDHRVGFAMGIAIELAEPFQLYQATDGVLRIDLMGRRSIDRFAEARSQNRI